MTATRKGYDSTSAADCPNDGEVYGGYIDGTYSTNYADLKRLHPKALVFSIGRFASSKADFYDVENGLLTPEEGAHLAKGNIERGDFAGLYMNESTWPSVKAAVKAAGIEGKVAYWVAWEQDSKDDTIPVGAVGRQYLLSPGRSPGHYDVSNWIAHIPGLDSKPDPKRPRPMGKLLRHAVKYAIKRYNVRTADGYGLNAPDDKLTSDLIAAAKKNQATK